MSSSEEEIRISKEYAYEVQLNRFNIFKSQDLQNGHFDVVFDVEGKKLHGHKFILTSASETLDSWLSDRWTKEDEIIKVESYSFDNFYQFLCFIYSGSCDLTLENVLEMVDISEFYAVPHLKILCDRFLSENPSIITLENVEEMFELSNKYSLQYFLKAIKKFADYHSPSVCMAMKFINYKKCFVKFLLLSHGEHLSAPFFETIYKWAERQVLKQKDAGDDEFAFQEAVKAEVYTVLPRIPLSTMGFEFLRDFYIEKGFILSATELFQFYRTDPFYSKTKRFKWVYQLAEKQCLRKQKMSSTNDFNLAESIKADLSVVMADLKLYKIPKTYVMDVLVANGILSEEEAIKCCTTYVEFINDDKIISGVFLDEFGIRKSFEKYAPHFANDNRQRGSNKCRFFNIKIPIPKIPSTVTKMKGVDWYLCLEKDGVLTVKEHSLIERNDYLLAAMNSSDDSPLKPKHYTCLTFSDNN